MTLSLGIAAAALLFCIWMGQWLEKAPLMKDCSECGEVWPKKDIFFTEGRVMCPKCLGDFCDKKTEENYRRAGVPYNPSVVK